MWRVPRRQSSGRSNKKSIQNSAAIVCFLKKGTFRVLRQERDGPRVRIPMNFVNNGNGSVDATVWSV